MKFVEATTQPAKAGLALPAKPGLSLGTRFNADKITKYAAIIELARSFPTLESCTPTDPGEWDIARFMAKADASLSSGGIHAALFVASVWHWDWPSIHGREFRVAEAMCVWDEQHRRAFLQWCEDPFFP